MEKIPREDTWLNDVALKVKFPRIYALELEKNSVAGGG